MKQPSPLRYRYGAIRLLLAMQPGHAYTRATDPTRTSYSTIRVLEARGLVAWHCPEASGPTFYHLTAAGEAERLRLARELPVR